MSNGPIDHPTLEISGTSYPIVLNWAVLNELRKIGLDLFAQPPHDSHADAMAEAQNEIRCINIESLAEALDGKDQSPENLKRIADLTAIIEEHRAQLSDERKAWEHPLDQSHPTAKFMANIEVVSAVLRIFHKKPEYSLDKLAELIGFEDTGAVFVAVSLALKKAADAMNRQTIKAEPSPSVQ